MIRLLLLFEIISFIGLSVSGLLWFFGRPGNWEPITVCLGAVLLGVDIARRVKRKTTIANRFANDGAKIQHRERLRKEFEEELYKCRAQKLRQDVIVRHVDRVDDYPNTPDDKPGISSWFRVGFLDMYERGIVLCLQIGGLKKCEGGYRFVDYKNNEKSDLTAWLMADVPYDSIEAVNVEGDKYYYYPHIYCYFDYNGEPYERKWFAEKIDQPHGHPYFKKIAEYEDVKKNNPQNGSLYFA